MAEDNILMKRMPPQSLEIPPEPTEYSLRFYDEQRLAHFGKRQQFRVSRFSAAV